MLFQIIDEITASLLSSPLQAITGSSLLVLIDENQLLSFQEFCELVIKYRELGIGPVRIFTAWEPASAANQGSHSQRAGF